MRPQSAEEEDKRESGGDEDAVECTDDFCKYVDSIYAKQSTLFLDDVVALCPYYDFLQWTTNKKSIFYGMKEMEQKMPKKGKLLRLRVGERVRRECVSVL